MESDGTTNLFDSLPQKAKRRIFDCFPQEQREQLRTVSISWNKFITEEFSVQIIITDSNFEKLFKCSRASHVTLSSLSTEYLGEIAFSKNVRVLQSIGKVLTCNLKRIFLACTQLESLSFISMKQVVCIEVNGRISLPSVKDIEIKVRSDQEAFTTDEVMVLNFLKNVEFGSLENILISVRSGLEWLAEQFREELPTEDLSLAGWDSDLSMGSVTHAGSQYQTSVMARFGDPEQIIPPMMMDAATDSGSNDTSSLFLTGPNFFQHINPSNDMSTTSTRTHQTVRTARTLPLIPGENASAGSGPSSDAFSFYQPEMSQLDVFGRFFNARVRAQIHSSGSSLDTILRDPRSRNEFLRLFDFRGPNQRAPDEGPPPFFQLLLNNANTLKKLIVKAKPEFMCVGNMTALPVEQIQFQELEYSFGRSQLCMEYPLLQSQSKLVKISLQIIEDLWDSLMIAVRQSVSTLKEMDVKVLSLSHEPLDLKELAPCSNLVMLKLFHYFEKKSLEILPTSLNRLVLNGPLSAEQLESMAARLENLSELTIIANYNGGNIDLRLFKLLVTMQKITKIILIQCKVDVADIVIFCLSQPNRLTIRVIGPTVIPDGDILGSQIQFVVVNITQPAPITTELKLRLK